jgi:hypothetical protein
MAILTKAQLQADNSASFADNNTQAITPQILRSYNGNIIDTLVDSLVTGSFAQTAVSNDFTAANQFTSISASSFISASAFTGDGSRLTNITASTALPISDEGVLLGYATQLNFSGSNISASIQANIATISVNTNNLVTTSSFNSFTASVNSFTASQETKDTTLQTYTASVNTKFTAVGSSTASLNQFTSSQETKNTTLATYTGSVNSSLSALNSYTASNDTSITNLNSFTSSQNTKNTTLASYTGSNDTKWSTLGSLSGSFITESETGSFAILGASNTFTNTNNFTSISASSFVSGTFFVGDGSKLTNIPGAIPLTSLNSFTASQLTINSAIGASTSSLNTFSASALISINALNQFTASQSTASLVTSITNLNTFSSSVLTQLSTLANVTSSLISKTGSYATTGSNTFIGDQTITGNITAFSASFTYLQTIFESSSVIYSSGSNQFGDELSDTQTLSGSVKVQGSLTINGTPVQTSSVDISALNSFTSSQLTINTAIQASTSSLNTFSASALVSISNLNSFTSSQETKDTTLASVTSSLNTATASLFTSASLGLTTASFSGNTLTFTKGNGTTFGIVIPDVSGSGGTFATLGANTFTGSQTISSSLNISGSAFGNVVSMSITSNTASMDLNIGNYFTLTLADTATTHISASNVQPGVSATLVITTGTNSSASLAPTMLQPSGSSYSATNGSSKKDILSIVAVASGVPFVVSTKNMI